MSDPAAADSGSAAGAAADRAGASTAVKPVADRAAGAAVEPEPKTELAARPIALARGPDVASPALDADLDTMPREALLAEVRKLRAGIHTHRDSSGHALCWYQPQLWSLLPEGEATSPDEVPAWPQFLRGCISYRASLDSQCPSAPRTTEEF